MNIEFIKLSFDYDLMHTDTKHYSNIVVFMFLVVVYC